MTASSDWVRDSFAQKIAKGIFKPVNHCITADHEDRFQEAIAKTYEVYARNAERGKIMDDALLVHAAKLRANDIDHRFGGAAGARIKGDVFDPRNYIAGKVEVLRLESVGDDEHDGGQLGFGFAEAMNSNPTRKLNSAIDLENWLAGLSELDRDILRLRGAGHGLEEIGAEVGYSTSMIFWRCKQLGRELAARAGIGESK